MISGSVIRRARKEREWSQVELAAKIGLRQDSVSRIEDGENVDEYLLPRFDKAFGGDEWRRSSKISEVWKTALTLARQTESEPLVVKQKDDIMRLLQWICARLVILEQKVDAIKRTAKK